MFDRNPNRRDGCDRIRSQRGTYPPHRSLLLRFSIARPRASAHVSQLSSHVRRSETRLPETATTDRREVVNSKSLDRTVQNLSRQRVVALFGPSVGFTVYLLSTSIARGWSVHIPAFCLFKIAFGMTCPGCGITTALLDLLAGNWSAALQINPAAPAVLTFFITSAAVGWLEVAGTISSSRSADIRLHANQLLTASLLITWVLRFLIPLFVNS